MQIYETNGVVQDSFEVDGLSLTAEPPPVDTTPPETTIDARPAATTSATDASFSFSASEAGSAFQCSLDGAVWGSCGSPAAYTGLAPGNHEFGVRAVDAAGNTDPTPATADWAVQEPPPAAAPDPVVVAAGDVACAPGDLDYNGGLGRNGRCQQKATADLIGSLGPITALLPLGDAQYGCGELPNFQSVYDTTWGRFKSITHPIPGNHEYGNTSTDGCARSSAAGYYSYFGAAAGDPGKGYYSYDLGSWHLIALNSECWAVGGCGAGSPEETWLKADLGSHPALCTLAYWHDPRWSVGQTGNDATFDAFWQDLYAAHAELVLSGHDHTYQRYGRQNPSGQIDLSGVREIVVGTGGEELFGTLGASTSLTTKNNTTFGVLKLVLHQDGYDAQFVPAPGSGGFNDAFSTACVR